MKNYDSWIAEEFSGSDFGDQRLNNRFLKIAKNFSSNSQSPITQSCENWSDARACYR
jgi:hypothetical protein